jgi:hypothetical protein
MIKQLTFGLALLFPITSIAFECHFTLIKNKCWVEDYEISVVLMGENNKKISTVTVPKGEVWGRESFSCEPGQRITYSAIFNPTIWKGHENEIYYAKTFWYLPTKPDPKARAWHIQVFFPSAFSDVPLPPKASGNCPYDTSTVTPIPPIKE